MPTCTPDDLFNHRALTGLSGSIQHASLAFKVTRALRESDDYERVAWCLRDGNAQARPWTSAEFGVVSPTWSPDGKTLAFVSSRGADKTQQVFVLRSDGGEARRLTRAREAIGGIEAWSPDGKRLLITASVDFDEDRDPDAPNDARSPEVARYLPYKQDGTGIVVGERTHLFAVELDSGKLTAMTQGDFDAITGRWSPDGKRFAYLRHVAGRQRHRIELWLADTDGAGERLRVSSIESISQFAWSPDGRHIAFSGTEDAGDSAVALWLIDVDGDTAPRRLGDEDFELEPTASLTWHVDGDRLAVVADHCGLARIAIVSIASGEVRILGDALRSVSECTAWGRDRLAFIVASMRLLEEVHSIDWNGNDERVHTRCNAWFRKRPRPHVKRRVFEVPDGNGGTERIRAWVLTPDGDRPFPALIDMHGGPHSNVLVDYAAHTYWYALLSRGWTIVAPDAVGSAGYGRDFAHRLRGRWGELDLPQYDAVIDTLQREGVIDARIACGGKSYGGFLSAWAVGHSRRFRAAFISAPVANVLSHFGTSDTGAYVTPWLMDAEYTDATGRWDANSAVRALAGATTPTLILQGENDGRCPRGQSEEVFTHLVRYSEAPVEFVVYPRSSHSEAEAGRPSNRLDYHARICRWLERALEEETP